MRRQVGGERRGKESISKGLGLCVISNHPSATNLQVPHPPRLPSPGQFCEGLPNVIVRYLCTKTTPALLLGGGNCSPKHPPASIYSPLHLRIPSARPPAPEPVEPGAKVGNV